MRHFTTYRILGALLLLSLGSACSREQQELFPDENTRGMEVRIVAASAESLATPLYLFRRDAGTQQEYLLERIYESVQNGQTIRLPLAQMQGSDYRFLMIAQPAQGAWLALRDADGAPVAAGMAWSALRLASDSGAAELEGYCAYTDMSGAEILAAGNISLRLTRIAGQLLFDFYRIAGSLTEPEGIVSAEVASVLDRVSRIEIEYGQATSALRFDAQGTLVPAAYASQPVRQVIVPAATDFKVSLPQTDAGLLSFDPALRGSLRMQGVAALPSDAKLRVKITFTYYDTTPACNNTHEGAHTADCYRQKELTLYLPQAASMAGLPVASDCYTVNRAGLRADRIIDVPMGGGIETDFTWDEN